MNNLITSSKPATRLDFSKAPSQPEPEKMVYASVKVVKVAMTRQEMAFNKLLSLDSFSIKKILGQYQKTIIF